MTSIMPDLSVDATETFCNQRKAAMRLDEREHCDRGHTRAELAAAMGVSESLLTKWLAPSHRIEMPASKEALWMHCTRSKRLLKLMADQVGETLMDDRDRLMLRLVEWGLGKGSVIEVAA